MDVICVFCSAARSSTCPLASYPGTEHIRTGVFGLTCRPGSRALVRGRPANSVPVVGQGPLGAHADGQLSARGAGAHLCVHDVGQVEWLLHDGHEGLPEVGGHKHVRHGQHAVGAEGLDQEQAVDGLPDGSWNEAGRRVGDSTGLRRPPGWPCHGPLPHKRCQHSTQTTPQRSGHPLSSLPANRQHPTSPQHPLGTAVTRPPPRALRG